MDRKIKTRQVHKDIKVLDKTVTVTDHVKQSYVRTKENVIQSTENSKDRDNNPVGYAEDAVSEYTDRIFHETGHQVRRKAEKLIERKKEKASVSSAGEETVYQPKEQMRPVPPSGGETAQEQGRELAVKKIKTIERDKRTIKTGRTSEQVVKNTGKGTIKASGKAVKTAEQTEKTSIKTSEQTANASVRAMHYSMKKAEKAVEAARRTAQNTRIAVKTTAKAVTHAIKALMEATKALLSELTAGGWIAVVILIIVILFGGFLCMTGGDNSSTVSSISAEVEAYEPLIRQYANQYGIGEYVELIKAIMMQESGGRGLDPMQCSEGSFNTKYPRQPNGITDPEYSISCGVQEIKSCLERAGVKNLLDMENIKLALQSYNYGNGYLEWAKARGGYTLANADRIFRYDGTENGVEQLWGQAVCATCTSVLCIWKNPDRHRQSGNRSGGSITGRKRRNNLLELVWFWKPSRVVCLLCVMVCRPERLYPEWSHSQIFSLFGRCQMV